MTDRYNLPWIFLVSWTVVGFLVGGVSARAQTGSLPAGWQDLPPKEFVAVARGVMSAAAPDAQDVEAIRLHAARLLATQEPASRVAYGDFVALYSWGEETMTAGQRDEAVVLLARPKGEFAGWNCAQLLQTSKTLEARGVPYAARLAMAVAWLGENDAAGVAALDDLAWLCVTLDATHYHLPQEAQATAEQLGVVRAHVAERISTLQAQLDSLPYQQQVLLYRWGREELTAQQRAARESALAGANLSAETVRNWSVWELERTHRDMTAVGLPEATREGVLTTWLENRDLESLKQAWPIVWLAKEVARLGEPSGDLSVVWNGRIDVPRDGEYHFSTSPINVNVRIGANYVRQALRVRVGGELVLDAAGAEWLHEGIPVQLTAGQHALRVEFSHERTEGFFMPQTPAVAKLYWKGPGVDRELVPASAFSLNDGSGSGLQAEYRFSTAEGTRSVTQTDKLLDHAWFGSYPIRAKYPALRSRLIERLSALAVDPDYLAIWDRPEPPHAGHALWQGPRLVELMNSAQQAACMRELAGRPIVLANQPGLWTVDLFWGCRVGAPGEALEFLGTWAQLHPDAEPPFGQPYEIFRQRYRRLADAVVWQYAPHGEQLEEQYLTTPDGGCCLSVAYILAHGYREKGQVRDWIDLLDARLDALPTVGDVRVNWLIARAHAEDIRHGRGGRGGLPLERMLAGRGFLEEALLAAESEPARLRVYKELAVRLAAKERLAEAAAVLDDAAAKLTATASDEALPLWQQQLEQVAVQLEERRVAAETQVQEAYVQKLRNRRQRAQQRDDRAAVARYEQLIQAAGVSDQ